MYTEIIYTEIIFYNYVIIPTEAHARIGVFYNRAQIKGREAGGWFSQFRE